MTGDWRTERLGDVCDLIARGIAPVYLDDGGLCVVNQKCIRDHAVDYRFARRHDGAAKSVPNERLLRVGDVLVNSTGTGTLGRVAQVKVSPPEPTTVDTHVTIVRPKAGFFHPDFFGYVMTTIEAALTAAGEGASGQTELPRNKLENDFEVRFPKSLAEQQRIVAILDEAFEGIARAQSIGTETIENLDRLAAVVLGEMFEKATLGERRRLADLSTFQGGAQPPKSTFVQQPREGYVRLLQIRDFSSDKYAVYIPIARSNKLCSDTDIMIGRYGASVGQIHRGKTGAYNVALIRTSPDNEQIDSEYFYLYLKSDLFQRPLAAVANRSAQAGFSKDDIADFEVPVPALGVQRELVEVVEGLSAELASARALYMRKLTLLAELKQSLLARAFSGELIREPVAA